MANPNPSPENRFKPGESGNPGGRPAGITDLKALVAKNAKADWEAHGESVLIRLRETDPAAYVRVIAQLLPKESRVDVEHSGGIAHEHTGLPETARWLAELAEQSRPEPLQD